jgi:hypothetical protein
VSTRVRVWIAGPETLGAGMQALYTINVAKDSSVAAGFDVASFFGDVGVYDSVGTQLMRIDPNNPVDSLELTHAIPRLAAGHDTVTWSFYYHAPSAVGRIDTIYAVGNSVDLSFDPDGDHWNYAPNFLVRIVPPTNVQQEILVRSFSLAQNYPNPFNPSTLIRFEMPVAGWSSLAVYDMTGRQLKEFRTGYLGAGIHEVNVVADQAGLLSSGVYLYRVVVQSSNTTPFVATKKMLLLK